MIALQRFFIAAVLIVATPVAGSILIGSSALAANCAGSISKCISISKDKPDAIAKCTAAGESCKKTGVFVGPYTGTSFSNDTPSTKKKSGGCTSYSRNRACY